MSSCFLALPLCQTLSAPQALWKHLRRSGNSPLPFDKARVCLFIAFAMKELSRILFHVYPCYADAFFYVINLNINITLLRQRLVILGNLIPLWQIRIKVILSRKDAFIVNLAMRCYGHLYCELNRCLIEDRECSRH